MLLVLLYNIQIYIQDVTFEWRRSLKKIANNADNAKKIKILIFWKWCSTYYVYQLIHVKTCYINRQPVFVWCKWIWYLFTMLLLRLQIAHFRDQFWRQKWVFTMKWILFGKKGWDPIGSWYINTHCCCCQVFSSSWIGIQRSCGTYCIAKCGNPGSGKDSYLRSLLDW